MNCIHSPSLTLPRCRYMGSAWLSRAASWCYRPVATDQPVENKKVANPTVILFLGSRGCRAQAPWRGGGALMFRLTRFAGESCSNHLFDLNGAQSHHLIHCAWA